jgi:hypothetical protein
MTFAFIDFGAGELVYIIIYVLLVFAAGNYGRNTALGFLGSILLAIFFTPLIAFIVIVILRAKRS